MIASLHFSLIGAVAGALFFHCTDVAIGRDASIAGGFTQTGNATDGGATASESRETAADVLRMVSERARSGRRLLLRIDNKVIHTDRPLDRNRHAVLTLLNDEQKALYYCDDRRPGQTELPHRVFRWSYDGKVLRSISTHGDSLGTIPIVATETPLQGSLFDKSNSFFADRFIDPRAIALSNGPLLWQTIRSSHDGFRNMDDLATLAADTNLYRTSVQREVTNAGVHLKVIIQTISDPGAAQKRSPIRVEVNINAVTLLPTWHIVTTADSVQALQKGERTLVQESTIEWLRFEDREDCWYPATIVYREVHDGRLRYHEKSVVECKAAYKPKEVPDEVFGWHALSPALGQPLSLDNESVLRFWDGSRFAARQPLGSSEMMEEVVPPQVAPRLSTGKFLWFSLNVLVLSVVLILVVVLRKRKRTSEAASSLS